MRVTLCGSIAFMNEMIAVKEKLEAAGHEVKLPPYEVADDAGNMIPVMEYYRLRKAASKDDAWIWERKEEAMRMHFDKVAWADAVLVVNETKKDIFYYIGGNTFLEMGVAFHLGKKIFLLHPIPAQDTTEEIIAMRPVVLNGDLANFPSVLYAPAV